MQIELGKISRRMLRALLLDKQNFQEVATDHRATPQALLVVFLAALATGVGGLDNAGLAVFRGFPGALVLALVGWVVGAFLAYLIGTKVLRTPETNADFSRLARALGFAQAPAILRVLGLVPSLGPAILLVTLVWQLVCLTVALREALNYKSYWRAVSVLAVGFVPYATVVTGLALLIEAS